MSKTIGRICVTSCPSTYGGADTELLMQMMLWVKMGIEVHMIHNAPYSSTAKPILDDLRGRGVIIHKEQDYKKIDGMPAISYCSKAALINLDKIRKYTDTFIFVNCMTWLFEKEKERVKEGLITHELYQRREVHENLLPQLRLINKDVKGAVVKPYFDASKFPFNENRNFKDFTIGRISREDANKYRKDTLQIMEAMTSPKMKKGIFLGVGAKTEKKIGKAPSWISYIKAGGITANKLYDSVNVIMQPCDQNHTENLPRISFEAMASGVLLVVDNKGGFKDQVVNGETGWLVGPDFREWVYKGSRVAFEDAERIRMARAARDYLNDNWGSDACIYEWTEYFKDTGVIQ